MIETISILPVISKPLERHVARSYLDYLTSNTLLDSKQSAYRQYYSCETALLSLTDNWLKAMDSKDLVGAVMLNLSRAFDLVNHSLLLSKLSMYHTDNTSLRWFESYHTIELSDVVSMDHCLTHYQLLEAFHKVPFQ